MKTVKYALEKNNLDKSNNESYRGRIIHNGIVDVDTLIHRMGNRGGAGDVSDITAKVMLFIQEVKECIHNGEVVNIPLFSTNYSMKGVFNGENDSFDPNRHQIKINLNGSKNLSSELKELSVEKVDPKYYTPSLTTFTNEITKEQNTNAESNAPASIEGRRLKLSGNNPNVGIYFKESTTGEEIKVSNILTNTSKRLVFITPLLTPGEWIVSVVTESINNKEKAKLSKGELIHSLTVL